MFSENVYKIVLSKPKSRQTEYRRIDIEKNENMYQASMYGAKKVSHKNMDFNQAKDFVSQNFGDMFLQFNAWDGNLEYESKASKKGKVISSQKVSKSPPKKPKFLGDGFNRQKHRIVKEGDAIHALVDMGVFTKDFKIISGMRDKFVQVNRFLEVIDDEVRKRKPTVLISIIDIGCGKSYLTFLLHHYFTVIQGFDAEICGLDSDAGIVLKCMESVEKYNYQRISFCVADIKQLESPPIESFGKKDSFSVAVSLHACDTASDYAISKAVKWNADLILVAPCCQHELADQIKPKDLTILADYGIIRERFCSIATDLVRAKLLESFGYRVQLIEFAGFLHTEKNLLIRARKTGRQNRAALADIEKLCDEFGFSPSLLSIVR